MPAQQQHFIVTAYLTGTTGTVAAGTVLCFTNIATDRFVIATTANLATYGQNPAGIALTAADNDTPYTELQLVGFVPNSITGLGAGAAGDICVSALGVLARGSSPVVVGKCDAGGNAMVNFAGIGVGGGGGGGGAPTDATYVAMSTNGTLTNERVLTAGTGITVTDGGAGAAVTIASTITQGAPTTAQYLTLATDATLTNERVLTAGTNISFVDGGAGGALTINASAGGGANPAGSGSEIQYRVNGTTFGAVSGASSNGTKIDFSTDPTWTKAAQVGTLAWTPTATRTATIPDATDTLVGKATTDTLTNKTYSLSGTGNVLTDTSIAQYDIIMANATPAFKRLAKGPNNTLLQTNLSGVVQWATAVPAMLNPGTNGQVLTTTGGATTWGNTATFFGLGSGTLATSGLIRVASATQSVIRGVLASTVEADILATNTSNDIIIGSTAWSILSGTANQITLWGNSANGVRLISGVSGFNSLLADGVNVKIALPVAGWGTALQFKTATVDVSGGGTITLTTAQFECPFLDLTGSPVGLVVVAPNTSTSTFNVKDNNTNTFHFRKTGGTGVLFGASSSPCWVIHNGTDYEARGPL